MNSSNSQTSIYSDIIKDKQIKRFCLYGFLKNLRFYEAYLLLFLLSQNINLFEIGVLVAIREIIVAIFEVPSGMVADYFGRKKELCCCFVFYIIAFVLFFFTKQFSTAVFAMLFYGLGEAFRSGTHKAMIYTYLDLKNWQKEKTFVYGRTRSFSLLGSALSAILGILLMLVFKVDRLLFLFALIPTALDFILISSYPKVLDKSDKKKNTSFKQMLQTMVTQFKNQKMLLRILCEEGISEASFSYTKDIIQPLLETVIVGSGLVLFSSLTPKDHLVVMLGLVYAIFNVMGAWVSKKTYLLKGNRSSLNCLQILHVIFGALFLVLGLVTQQAILVCIIYIILVLLHSMRKPLFVDEVDNHINKSTRATTLSMSAQLKSLFLVIFAPTLGYIMQNFGIAYGMFGLSLLFLLTIPLLKKVEFN